MTESECVYTYDELGRIASVTQFGGRATAVLACEFDELGRIVKVTGCCEDVTVESFEYDIAELEAGPEEPAAGPHLDPLSEGEGSEE